MKEVKELVKMSGSSLSLEVLLGSCAWEQQVLEANHVDHTAPTSNFSFAAYDWDYNIITHHLWYCGFVLCVIVCVSSCMCHRMCSLCLQSPFFSTSVRPVLQTDRVLTYLLSGIFQVYCVISRVRVWGWENTEASLILYKESIVPA